MMVHREEDIDARDKIKARNEPEARAPGAFEWKNPALALRAC